MGTSTDGILIYGYDLGGEESGWQLEGLNEDESWKPVWLDTDEDDEPDLVDAVQERLLRSVGFTETDWRADGYWERRRAAQQRVGVELVQYCSGEYPMYLLAAHELRVARGRVATVDFAELDRLRREEGWSSRLARALETLEIKPQQPAPKWLLASYWA